MNVEFIGIASVVSFTLAEIPQIHKNWTTKSSEDISTKTILLTYVATSLGIVYGALIDHIAVYIGNSITLFLFVVLHAVKFRNERLLS
jgi:MtN3 and saliva related transmembrane protein